MSGAAAAAAVPQLVKFFESSAAPGQDRVRDKLAASQAASRLKRPSSPAPAGVELPEEGNASAIAAAQYALPMTDGETDQELSDDDDDDDEGLGVSHELPAIQTNGAQLSAC